MTTTLKKILVVDDDPVVGKSFDRVLAPKGYAVIAAANGEEALARLATESYDMVYTDIKMPGMDGLEVAKRIKASRPWLPVVIITGYGSETNEAQARELGVAEFLKKPLSPEMIEGSAHFAFPALALPAPAAATPAAPAAAGRGGALGFLKSVGLFLAAPFLGLAYVVFLPVLGMGIVGWLAFRVLTGRPTRQD